MKKKINPQATTKAMARTAAIRRMGARRAIRLGMRRRALITRTIKGFSSRGIIIRAIT
jgi:hypothetical protein